jgi:hypothetical protein
MATITSLRQTWLSPFLGRVTTGGAESAETRPWNNLNLDTYLTMAIDHLWPEMGMLVADDIVSGGVNEYDMPEAMERIARIDVLEAATLRYIDRVANFTVLPGFTRFVIKPPAREGLLLRVSGWRPYDPDGADLPRRLESAVAEKAASLAYAALAGELLHSQRQQNLDPGRFVSYGDASAQSAYWEARYRNSVVREPSRVAVGPRSAYR